jgi:ABC-type dipeptide/oligopeptide/nickel transport system ATPase component
VVRNLCLDIRPGECLALVGESGSGKSVTAHSILQLLPEVARKPWQHRYRGQELLGAVQRIARTARQPHRDDLPGADDLAQPAAQHRKADRRNLLVHKAWAAKRRNAHLELLELVGIQKPKERLKAYPHQLSGGQRQRVMIAMALACEPELLIADEPTTALDVTVQRKILLLLKSLQQRLGMSLLLISHDLNLVRSIAQRVCVMQAGEIVEQAVRNLFTARSTLTAALLNAEPAAKPCPGRTRERAGGRRPARAVPVGGGLFQRKTYLRGGRHQPERAARQDPGHRRRIRLGQIHPGPGDPAPARFRGQHPLSGHALMASTRNRCARGARCRWCSRTRSAASARACRWRRSSAKAWKCMPVQRRRVRREVIRVLKEVGLDPPAGIAIPTSFPAASASASPSPGRWC